MCEKHLYTYDSATGVEKFTERQFCSDAVHGKTCRRTKEYRHTHGEVPYGHSTSRMPPSPPLSDASFPHSGSDRSYQYLNGVRVFDVNRKPSHRPRRNSTLVVPTTYVPPRTTPPHSPPRPYVVQHAAAPPSPTFHDRPVRYYPPAAEVAHYEPNETRRRRSHSHSRHGSDEARRLQRGVEEAKEALRQQKRLDEAKEALRQQKRIDEAKEALRQQKRIDEANKRINERPPAATRLPPAPPAPQPLRYRRGSVSIPATNLHRVHFEADDEAQLDRLRARMEPTPVYRF